MSEEEVKPGREVEVEAAWVPGGRARLGPDTMRLGPPAAAVDEGPAPFAIDLVVGLTGTRAVEGGGGALAPRVDFPSPVAVDFASVGGTIRDFTCGIGNAVWLLGAGVDAFNAIVDGCKGLFGLLTPMAGILRGCLRDPSASSSSSEDDDLRLRLRGFPISVVAADAARAFCLVVTAEAIAGA